jgi:hypothetical protein
MSSRCWWLFYQLRDRNDWLAGWMDNMLLSAGRMDIELKGRLSEKEEKNWGQM